MRGGEGGGRSTKKKFAQGKIKRKKFLHANRSPSSKKYSYYGLKLPKTNSYKEFDNERKFLPLENSPPPHNFSNGPSLSITFTSNGKHEFVTRD